jgi:hypothetical protein
VVQNDDNDNQNTTTSNSPKADDEDPPERDEKGRLLPKSHTLQLKPLSHNLVGQVIDSPQGLALQRLSPTLKSLCSQFQHGMIGVLEFMELLEHAMGIRDPAMAELKKQAFRVAGDMGTALKLLYEQCLPPKQSSASEEAMLEHHSSHHSRNRGAHDPNANSIELLQCILEFFLDLVEEGELNTLAFFWPQISNIHLQMLPPRDTTSLQKIELFEDFLLTVASKHSIHLAIQLVWSHTADLEDGISGSHNTTATCGQRKSAVLRFLCELESLLFDFDTGWGGGSVTVGQFLSPSNHQIDLLRNSMGRIQSYRLAAEQDCLSRSHRLSKLKMTMTHESTPPEILAQEALRIAKNADYLSSHLVFTKRLCDIAEKLRFLPISERPDALQEELSRLNASGTMGGDPLNKIKKDEQGHTRVVRIPITEGHVFRSKERTPVLLLVETLDDGAEEILEDEFAVDKTQNDYSSSEANTDVVDDNSDVASNHNSTEEEKKEVNAETGEETPASTEGPLDGNDDAESKSSSASSEGSKTKESNTEAELPTSGFETPIAPKAIQSVETIDEGSVLPDISSPIQRTSGHNRVASLHATQSEGSMSMAGSQDGILDDGSAARRKCDPFLLSTLVLERFPDLNIPFGFCRRFA